MGHKDWNCGLHDMALGRLMGDINVFFIGFVLLFEQRDVGDRGPVSESSDSVSAI